MGQKMTIRIVEESGDRLAEYAAIPIAFRVASRFRLQPADGGPIGFLLVEEPVEPYIKDYDTISGEGPLHWKTNWDLSNWGFLAAFNGKIRVGGAAIAWNTSGMCDLDGRDDLAALWDIRVHPDFRGCGVGSKLFESVMNWSLARGCRALQVETQNINVPACRFYAHQGCELGAINRFAYAPALDEVQLIWHRPL